MPITAQTARRIANIEFKANQLRQAKRQPLVEIEQDIQYAIKSGGSVALFSLSDDHPPALKRRITSAIKALKQRGFQVTKGISCVIIRW